MIAAWQKLGLELIHDAERHELTVVGCAGQAPVSEAEIFIANSGTTIRFLTAAFSTLRGTYSLDGIPRMRERPIGDLLDALRNLGADIESLNPDRSDCPPVRIRADGLKGGETAISGAISSQFLSGLMLAGPAAESDVSLRIAGELVSVPYVEMTSAVMRSFGANVTGNPRQEIRVSSEAGFRGTEYAVEPDASAASYFWAAAAIAGGSATVLGLSKSSLQGDVRFCDVLSDMGCDVEYADDAITVSRQGDLRGVDVDMADISDTVQTLAAVALFADGPTKVRGVAHNRLKETDRIRDLATELRKFGAEVEEYPDGLRIEPPKAIELAEIETYNDHRMAMSLSLVGLGNPEGVRILNPKCTSKTYPHYWEDLESFSGCRIDRSH